MIEETLDSRGVYYGRFVDNAKFAQEMKRIMINHDGWTRLDSTQREALEMIAAKIARIFNGDPTYRDNWHDIAGYATLAEQSLINPIAKKGSNSPSLSQLLAEQC